MVAEIWLAPPGGNQVNLSQVLPCNKIVSPSQIEVAPLIEGWKGIGLTTILIEVSEDGHEFALVIFK